MNPTTRRLRGTWRLLLRSRCILFRYGVSAIRRECERCGPGAWREGGRVKRGYPRLFGSPSVVRQLSSVGGFPPDGRQGRRMEGSSRVLGRAGLLSGDCVSTGVSALFFTYGRKCKK